jgi:hypothetical protein
MKIPAPYRAFSHKPGAKVMIPGTLWTLTAYPAELIFAPLDKDPTCILELGITGPVSPFTVEQDLKRKKVTVYGQAEEGYFRFSLQEDLIFKVEKAPTKGISYKDVIKKEKGIFFTGDQISFSKATLSKNPVEELFLGSNKAREFEKIRTRKDIKEILPLWHGLGQMTPGSSATKGAALDLLEEAEKAPSQELFLKLFLATLSEGFVPRGFDEERQGILTSEKEETAPYILERGAALIRSLFFKEEKGTYYLLPRMLSQLPCGKMLGIVTEDGSILNLEWTKHQIRTLEVTVKQDKELALVFPKDIKRFRLKTSPKDKGQILQQGEVISTQTGQTLFLDRFQK